MRLWSIHPKYLDAKGLVALWREALLAKHVLQGKTRGYRSHPQLIRFRASRRPLPLIHRYLEGIYDEAASRGYTFDRRKFRRRQQSPSIRVTRGQIQFEKEHLLRKLARRDRRLHASLKQRRVIDVHPIFKVIAGSRESWEKTGSVRVEQVAPSGAWL